MATSIRLPHGTRLLFGNGFDAPLWATEFGAGDPGAPSKSACVVVSGPQVIFATPTGAEASLSLGSEERLLRRQEVLVAGGRESRTIRLRSDGAGLLVLGFRSSVIASLMEPFRPGLLEPVRHAVFGTGPTGTAVLPPCTARAAELVESMRHPPVGGPALPFWFEGHVKALLACICFDAAPGEGREFFCSKQKRLGAERIKTAKALLKAHVEEPLNLQTLADAAGCSPAYLSRSFSAATGLTISQYHRKLRIERAASLLAEGRCNVSEAAIEVGYQSLSHFAKAFREVMGCTPSAYAA